MEPLAGIRVLALENYYAGNIGSYYLGRFGADVIKVEMPNGGDVLHHSGPFAEGPGGRRSIGEIRVMGGKRSVVINLKTADGLGLLMRLVSVCDVVWTNMKPNSLERIGITYESLKRANPRIVYATLSGFGHADLVPSGPYGELTAFDIIAQGMAGLQFRTGKDDDGPGYNGLALGDQVAALYAVMGIGMALLRREKTGKDQRVDVAMHDAMVALMELPLGYYLITGMMPTRGRSNTAAPFGAFPTDDGWVNLGVGGSPVWHRFCRALNRRDWLESPLYKDAMGRIAHRDEIEPEIAVWTKQRSTSEVMSVMAQYEVPCAPIWDIPQVVASPQAAARNMLVTVDDPVVGPRKIVGNPVKMNDLSDGPPPPAPLTIGEHTSEVLTELLGLTSTEIADLETVGAIASRSQDSRSRESKAGVWDT